jgi:hypothetical protein
MHIVTSARLLPVRLNSSAAVPAIRAPHLFQCAAEAPDRRTDVIADVGLRRAVLGLHRTVPPSSIDSYQLRTRSRT